MGGKNQQQQDTTDNITTVFFLIPEKGQKLIKEDDQNKIPEKDQGKYFSYQLESVKPIEINFDKDQAQTIKLKLQESANIDVLEYPKNSSIEVENTNKSEAHLQYYQNTKKVIIEANGIGAGNAIMIANKIYCEYTNAPSVHLILTNPTYNIFKTNDWRRRVIPPNVKTFVLTNTPQNKMEVFAKPLLKEELVFTKDFRIQNNDLSQPNLIDELVTEIMKDNEQSSKFHIAQKHNHKDKISVREQADKQSRKKAIEKRFRRKFKSAGFISIIKMMFALPIIIYRLFASLKKSEKTTNKNLEQAKTMATDSKENKEDKKDNISTTYPNASKTKKCSSTNIREKLKQKNPKKTKYQDALDKLISDIYDEIENAYLNPNKYPKTSSVAIELSKKIADANKMKSLITKLLIEYQNKSDAQTLPADTIRNLMAKIEKQIDNFIKKQKRPFNSSKKIQKNIRETLEKPLLEYTADKDKDDSKINSAPNTADKHNILKEYKQ